MFDIQKFGLHPVKPSEEFHCDLWEMFSLLARKSSGNKMNSYSNGKIKKFHMTVHLFYINNNVCPENM